MYVSLAALSEQRVQWHAARCIGCHIPVLSTATMHVDVLCLHAHASQLGCLSVLLLSRVQPLPLYVMDLAGSFCNCRLMGCRSSVCYNCCNKQGDPVA